MAGSGHGWCPGHGSVPADDAGTERYAVHGVLSSREVPVVCMPLSWHGRCEAEPRFWTLLDTKLQASQVKRIHLCPLGGAVAFV